MSVTPGVSTSGGVAWSSTSSPFTRADCAIADYARHFAGELAIVDPSTNRDDIDVTGHRATELTSVEDAA